MGITKVTIWVKGAADLLTKSPDPPSSVSDVRIIRGFYSHKSPKMLVIPSSYGL